MIPVSRSTRSGGRRVFFQPVTLAKMLVTFRTSINCFASYERKTSRPKNDRRDSGALSRWRKTESCWACLKVLWKERLSIHRVEAPALVTIRFSNQRDSTRPLPRSRLNRKTKSVTADKQSQPCGKLSARLKISAVGEEEAPRECREQQRAHLGPREFDSRLSQFRRVGLYRAR